MRSEVWGGSKACVEGKDLVGPVNANARFGVFSDTFLEEVCFALKANRFHSFERVPNFEVAYATKAKEESVSAEFDVVAHHGGVHPDQFNGKGIDDEFHFNCDSSANDLNNSRFWEPVYEF